MYMVVELCNETCPCVQSWPGPVGFLGEDTTMNVIPSSTGNMLTTLTDGGLQCAVSVSEFRGMTGMTGKRNLKELSYLLLLSKLRRVLRPCQRSWCLFFAQKDS